MNRLDIIIELIPLIFCIAVIMPLFAWAYVNANVIVEWMVSL